MLAVALIAVGAGFAGAAWDGRAEAETGQWQAQIFVSPKGSDSQGNGSEEKPFQTVSRAKAAVREINSDMTGDIAVVLREGVYELGGTVVFGNEDGGTNGHRVVWQSYPGEIVRIDGGKRVTDWRSDGNGVYSAPLEIYEVRQLFVNGSRGVLARSTAVDGWTELVEWKNADERITVETADLMGATDGEICVQMNWALNILRFRDAEPAGSVFSDLVLEDLESSVVYTRESPFKRSYQPCYFQNNRKFLDAPGEFFYDKSEKRLYYIPREGENLETAEVVVPFVDGLFRVEGAAIDDRAQNITFRGLIFEHSAFDGAGRYGFLEQQSNHYVVEKQGAYMGQEVPSAAVHVENADGVIVQQCVVRRCGGSGINLSRGVSNATVRGNLLTDLSATGILAGPNVTAWVRYGASEEDCLKIYPDNVSIDNNAVSWVGRDFAGANGILVGLGRNITVRNNEIGFVSYSGIGLGWDWSTLPKTWVHSNIVARNDIHHTSMVLADTAGIYTLGSQPGTQIRENFVHDIVLAKHMNPDTPAYGIYLDEGSNHMVVTRNVVRNTNEDKYLVFTNSNGYDNYVRDNFTENAEIEQNAGITSEFCSLSMRNMPKQSSFAAQIGLGTVTGGFDGEVGMAFQPKQSVEITSLGRFYVAGNCRRHELKLIDAESGKTLAKTVVDMSVGTPDANGFKYGALIAPLKLEAGRTYYLVSAERADGDLWIDRDTFLLFNGEMFEQETYLMREADAEGYLPARKQPGSCAGVNFLYRAV